MHPLEREHPRLLWIGVPLLTIAICIFTWRTCIRPGAWQWDFAIYSAASRAWGAGQNPYDEQLLYSNWKQDGTQYFHDISWLQSIVPPTTLALIYPFSALPRNLAFWSWYLFNCFALLITILALVDLTRLKYRHVGATLVSPPSPLSTHHSALSTPLILASWILLLGPIQSAIAAGQPAIAAVALIVTAACCASRKRDTLAGILLALAAGFKLQLAAPFILYYLYTSRWRIALTASTTFALIAALAILRLNLGHVSWLSDWTHNIQRASTHDGPNDFTTGNRNRDHLLNLQVPFYAMFTHRAIAHALAFTITGIAAIVYAFQLRRRKHATDELLFLAPLAILTLLPIYHRYYDASLLVIPLALCLPRWRDRRAQLILAILLVFLLPVGWAVNLVRHNLLSFTITTSHFWNLWIISLWPWLLLLMLIVLLLMLRDVILRVCEDLTVARASCPCLYRQHGQDARATGEVHKL